MSIEKDNDKVFASIYRNFKGNKWTFAPGAGSYECTHCFGKVDWTNIQNIQRTRLTISIENGLYVFKMDYFPTQNHQLHGLWETVWVLRKTGAECAEIFDWVSQNAQYTDSAKFLIDCLDKEEKLNNDESIEEEPTSSSPMPE